MEVSPHGLDVINGLAYLDCPPFGNDVISGGNAEQLLQDQRSAFARLFAERQNARVIAVKAEVVCVRLQRRVSQVLIGHHVELERLILLLGIDIENPEQHSEGVLFMQQPDFHQIRQVGNQAVGLTQE